MKKFLALVLALIMTFSLGTVAFAAETTTEEAPVVEEEAGALDWLLDLPFWTVGPMSWFAKVAFKLATVLVKIAIVFGIIDTDAILDQIWDMIINGNDADVEESTTAAAVLA